MFNAAGSIRGAEVAAYEDIPGLIKPPRPAHRRQYRLCACRSQRRPRAHHCRPPATENVIAGIADNHVAQVIPRAIGLALAGQGEFYIGTERVTHR